MSVAAAADQTIRRIHPTPNGAPWTLLALTGGAAVVGAVFGLQILVDVIGGSVQIVFIAFFARHLAFAISAMSTAPADLVAPDVDTGFRPTVSLLVACKNEAEVVEELVASLLALDYPAEKLQLVIVDDASTDGTGEILDELAAREPRIECLRRAEVGVPGKAAALNDAFRLATGEITFVFDADHRPRPDSLRRMVRHFEDPGVGAVQGRCLIRNERDAPVARLVAIDYLAGYLVNEYGRQSVFQMPAYGGANCGVRTELIRQVGGWNLYSVTEDTDLTMRIFLLGARLRFDATAVDEEEAVATLRSFWRQRYRWARGHQQVWRDYRRAIWRAPFLSLAEKVESTMFLLVFHVPVMSAAGLGVLAVWVTGLAHPIDPFAVGMLWTLLFLGPLAELGGGLLISRAPRRSVVVLPLFLPLFFLAIALCTKAWLDGILGRRYTWVKTGRAARLEPAG